MSPTKNKHAEEDAGEAEGREVKRLRFEKEGEVGEAASQMASSESSSAAGPDGSSSPQGKDKEGRGSRQDCAGEDEEEDEDEEEGLWKGGLRRGSPPACLPERI